ncbi:hypothetical protein BHE97_17125 [Aeromicrobium sp. PE09-221]|uniref:hypothetical protein n=1 Tax=Aeromicrobium sp. PE09-221 TaxID=1898043 RepID=UPI000B3E558C|nr:hypothetical protein [Aeromicrobium sp. PE09-221]OUZ07233.1 hypothetical protein BHE97_17125 [Aeromicrobium sp. PE09-221]
MTLPHVVVTAADTGTLTVNVDDKPFHPPDGDPPWTRATFGDLLDTVTRDRHVPVRIEVRETDGTVFTDLVQASRRPATGQPDPPADEPPQRDAVRSFEQVEVVGERFRPGEQVLVAIVIDDVHAGPDGTARAALSPGRIEPADEVVLVGRMSTTLRTQRVG